ncbi:MAG: NAD-binding protein [Chloroflexi bacterium]|nr:NAD-binding protein [Chloroflexota bacterium]
MSRHVMIVGCGRLGATAANALLDRGDRVTILDTDAENFRRLRPRTRLSMYVGDGTSHEVLRRTGIESVGAFIAATGRDTTNALAAQSAQTTFGIRHVVCRINDPIRSEMYEQLGLTTLNPNDFLVALVMHAMEE